MVNDYSMVCSFGPVEFGYYVQPDGGCVDEHKVVARFWDRHSCFLNEIILAYEDSPGEAIEVISQYMKTGIVFHGFYGKHTFSGGYKLINNGGQFVPVLMEQI